MDVGVIVCEGTQDVGCLSRSLGCAWESRVLGRFGHLGCLDHYCLRSQDHIVFRHCCWRDIASSRGSRLV